ncbi:ABC transporter permease [Geminicoccus flavidas]|uniref:ABC transporter permease n=1 Tax=Geminicoccus flavidas TaxID=2506407 RepID=UPI00135A2E2E|nr:iron ABC transporter permease [Geminicoccus flavidas]
MRSFLATALDRSSSHAGRGWQIAAATIAFLVVLPILTLLTIATQSSGDLWPHLISYVLPHALTQTALLLLGVSLIVVSLGTGSAWLVTAYDFPLRRMFEWALLLPLAIPTYIIAFAYLDLMHPIGPVQSVLRALFGLAPRDLRFLEMRSLTGCIFVLGIVLYPYVYLFARAMFLMQAASVVDAARMLGAGPLKVFFRVVLPMARPAIAVGTSLALMEAINDIGASEFLGVQTLTVSIYATWINRTSLPGAAQIAIAMLVVVVALIVLERTARTRQRYAAEASRARRLQPIRLKGSMALLAVLLCLVPVLLGFVAPALHLANEAWKRLSFAGFSPRLVEETLNTMLLAGTATLVIILAGLVVAFAARQSQLGLQILRVASLGYAVPGTVLAIGLLWPMAALDGALNRLGLVSGMFLSGSVAALIYAYAARFMAISAGGIEAGLARIPPSYDQAARLLGRTRAGTIRAIHLPLVRPALLTAALLVFVDCMKELPATLLLRPLAFETLATHLYGEAARGTYEDGAIAALLIVLFGLIPVILLARLSRKEG